ncbi:putative aromatic efflux pump inner membrane domain protein (plasmid) [Blastomonas sp. RAC04]|nr:putative aromatic efflux pump inner membrane domain protein [Blastomonas sp. RAC04]
MAVGSISGLGFSPEALLQMLSNMVEAEATTLAIIHIFWTFSAILLVAAALIWLAPRPKRSGGVSIGH